MMRISRIHNNPPPARQPTQPVGSAQLIQLNNFHPFKTSLHIHSNRPSASVTTTKMTPRTASITRITNETKIQVSLSLDGGVLPPYEPTTHFPPPSTAEAAEAAKTGIVDPGNASHATQFTPTQQITVSTGIGFLDHMLHALAKHGGWSLAVRARGDLYSAFSRPSLYPCSWYR